VTRSPLSRSKGQRSRSPDRFNSPRRLHIRQLQRWAWESIHPWEPTATLPSADAAVGSAAQSASAPTERGEGWDISWRTPAYSLLIIEMSMDVSATFLTAQEISMITA